MPFEMPESYRTYATDPAVRTAVDHLLHSKRLTLPADFGWNDLPAFHKAVLSAHQVRCEFAIFLYDLWREIWQPALEKCDFSGGIRELSVAETHKWNEYEGFDPYTIWNEGWFGGGTFEIAGMDFKFDLGTYADHETVRLTLAVYGAHNEGRSSELGLGDDWITEDSWENYVLSKEELVPIRAAGIDVNPLHDAAAQAITGINAYLQS